MTRRTWTGRRRRAGISGDLVIGLVALTIGVLGVLPMWLVRPPIVDQLLEARHTTPAQTTVVTITVGARR